MAISSKVDACNWALRLLGQESISSFDDGTILSDMCADAFEAVLRSELEANTWFFSRTLGQISASETAPDFGKDYVYPYPADWVKLDNLSYELGTWDRDWELKADGIHTDEEGPLDVPYIYLEDDPSKWNGGFSKVFAYALAIDLVEDVTSSNVKKEQLEKEYRQALRDAKKSKGIQKTARRIRATSWVTVR